MITLKHRCIGPAKSKRTGVANLGSYNTFLPMTYLLCGAKTADFACCQDFAHVLKDLTLIFLSI